MVDRYCNIELCMEFVLFDISVNAMCQVDVLEVYFSPLGEFLPFFLCTFDNKGNSCCQILLIAV